MKKSLITFIILFLICPQLALVYGVLAMIWSVFGNKGE
jgi:hypothetical protein